MKKIKQLSLILFISIGLFSCEAEKADEVITDQSLAGKQVFRFEVDGVTRVTDSVNVYSNGVNVSITAYVLSKDEEEKNKFKYDTFTVTLNRLATGTYMSKGSGGVTDSFMGTASANYRLANKNWYYSTDNIELGIENYNIQTGSLTISSINEKAQYFEGKFEFDLYAPKKENPNNNIAPVRMRNGYFQYIKYN